MSRESILQQMTSEPGQSQLERSPRELDANYFQVDARTPAQLLEQARAQAALMRFYAHDPKLGGDWTEFFPADLTALFASAEAQAAAGGLDGNTPPHLGLLCSFLELYQQPQALLNEFGARHRDFQYRRALRFEARPVVADRVVVLIELKKGAAPVAIQTQHAFTAGKDKSGVELVYQPTRSVVVGHAKVTALHSIYRDSLGVYMAPVANSADGLGAALDASAPRWSAFGHAGLPPAPIGFAIASNVLRLQEGTRDVRVELTLNGLDSSKHSAEKLAASFRAHATGPKGWLGPLSVTCSVDGQSVCFSFRLEATHPALIDYDPLAHAQFFGARAPIVQLLLAPGAPLTYAELAGLEVVNTRVAVDVQGMTTLALENDYGSLNPKKAFQPFGPQPVAGSRFLIGCDEALSKQLSDLRVALSWQGAPDLLDWYQGYSKRSSLASGVKALLVYQDSSGRETKLEQDVMQRLEGVTTLSPNQSATNSQGVDLQRIDRGLFSLMFSGSAFGRLLAQRTRLKKPMHQREPPAPPAPRAGFVTLALQQDFLHSDYQKESIEGALAKPPSVLRQPYTPTVAHIELGYTAASELEPVNVTGSAGETSFTYGEVQFFHVGCFGTTREHAFVREQLSYVTDKSVRLLPAFPDEGELLIGLEGVSGGDAVSLLIQVAPGSADPGASAPDVHWSVLCDNYWRPLVDRELTLDSTNHLTASGIVALALPIEASLDHSAMPPGRIWLRASARANSAAASRVIAIAANAVELAFVDQGNDAQRLGTPLPSGSIPKLKSAVAAVKKVAQPFASYGGRNQESSDALAQRAAERLRHRNRAVTPWDYERLLLEAFPAVHRVKCVPHASETSWLAPGNLLLIAVADQRNQNALEPLAPRVELDTLLQMQAYAQRRCGSQVKVWVRNPSFQRVKLDFQVRFRDGLPFNFYRNELEQALIQALSPWAFDATRELSFGGSIYRSVLLDFVEELPYVDFVTQFRMGVERGSGFEDTAQLTADLPDAILVSAASHSIAAC